MKRDSERDKWNEMSLLHSPIFPVNPMCCANSPEVLFVSICNGQTEIILKIRPKQNEFRNYAPNRIMQNLTYIQFYQIL